MSLNPFAARRERKEEQVKQKIADFQEQQQARGGGGGGALMGGGADYAAAGSMGSLALPETSYESEDFSKYLPASANVDQAPPSWDARKASPTYYEPPSRAWQCAYKLQNGFVIGASLGGAVGFLCARRPRECPHRT